MFNKRLYNRIPTALTEKEFNEFVLPYLKKGKRGPCKKLPHFKLFNYIMKLLYTGCQWSQIPIDKDENGMPEIHYTTIFKAFRCWVKHKCFDNIFDSSVLRLLQAKLLDYSILHGDGTNTAAKKGAII